MSSMRDSYQRGRRFVTQHARPIDYARWRFHFEGASSDTVLDILSQYQNSDGGFGHALEADFWNPLSSPMQTWAATEIIQSLNRRDGDHPIIQGILTYLEQTADFDGQIWSRTIATNNAYPHAEWWAYQDQPQAAKTYNPTAALAGFALQFANVGSLLHQRAGRIAAEAFNALLGSSSVEVHELSCFLRLFHCVVSAHADLGVDMTAVEQALGTHINASITRDTRTWSSDYVCRPSRFIRSRSDRWFSGNEDIVRYECRFLRQTQLDDGSWPVNWTWSSFPNEWPIAREWWKSTIIIENLQFLSNMDESSER